MVFPAVAARTFQMFQEKSSFRKLIKQMVRKISKLNSPRKRAQYVHSKIDKEVELLFQDPAVTNLVSCKKGCNACCHGQVSITDDEANLLVDLIENGLKIDWGMLWNQSEFKNDYESFLKLPYSMRSCIFLDESGECQVYDDRPSVCRTNFVVSDPDLCRIEAGKDNSVRLLNTFAADSWVYSLFKVSKQSGSLPFLVKKILSERKVQPKKDHLDL